MPTIDEINSNLNPNYFAKIEFNKELNSEIIKICDVTRNKYVNIFFKEKEMNIKEYEERVLIPCITTIEKD